MTGSIARRYAKALFALAREEGSLEQTGVELQQLATVAQDPQFRAVVDNPLLTQEARRAVARTLASTLALRPSTRNFVHVLADHQRLDQLVGIADQYRRLLDQVLRRVRARIVSAMPLSAAQEEKLVTRFERLTGKTVLPTQQVEPDLLGGVIVEIEGKVYDGSLQTQLQQLATAIAGGRSHL